MRTLEILGSTACVVVVLLIGLLLAAVANNERAEQAAPYAAKRRIRIGWAIVAMLVASPLAFVVAFALAVTR